MTTPVSQQVISAVEAPSTRITRRLEIYESDGVTPWNDAGEDSRLVDGSVTVDYNRDERRGVDLTLDNEDRALDHNPDGFWYDKILKLYRGVDWDVSSKQPKILVIYDTNNRVRDWLRQIGYYDVTVNILPERLTELRGYDIIVADAASYTWADEPGAINFIKAAYDEGYNILTSGNNVANNEVPWYTASIAKPAGTAWSMTPVNIDSPFRGGWSATTFSDNDAGFLPTGLVATARAVATQTYSATVGYNVAYNVSVSGARWFHFGPAQRETNGLTLLAKAVAWLHGYTPTKSWETQVGEFMIDKIDEDDFPNTIRITGRDYTKKMLGSKIAVPMTFSTGTDVAELLGAVAANAGITRTNFDTQGVVLEADVSFEGSTERWKLVKDICEVYQLEAFFDPYGQFAVRPFRDPVTSPASLYLRTGTDGNLASYTKSSNDSRIFNHVVVKVDNTDTASNGLLIWAEVRNTEPSSPTRIERLGERTNEITTSLASSTQQAFNIARNYLSVMALESYEVGFDSLVYPWLEAGEILDFADPRRASDQPSRFLFDTFSIPMSLGPMSGTGKRVTIVGSGSTPGDYALSDYLGV